MTALERHVVPHDPLRFHQAQTAAQRARQIQGLATPEAKEAQAFLADRGEADPFSDQPEEAFDGLATRLMDCYRRTRDGRCFELLVEVARPQLLGRVRMRTRHLGDRLDPQEMLQDALINIYRYPDRFDAGRPGAFRAWSSTIVDNSIRRHLRKSGSGPEILLQGDEVLAQHASEVLAQPGVRAAELESYRDTVQAYMLFLGYYLEAFASLSDRERFVMQMVEVRGMRYAELAGVMEMRPEALKMVVFRARKRIGARMDKLMALEHVR